MRIIRCIKGHYEKQEVEFGRVYKRCPEFIVMECCCGERLILTASTTTCGRCGAAH